MNAPATSMTRCGGVGEPIDCSDCGGLCCKNVAGIIDAVLSSEAPESVKQEYRSFPWGVEPDGACEMLTEDNTCADYQHRPVMCNSEKFHKKHVGPGASYEDFKSIVGRNCEALKKAFKR